jgi:predicted DCC family thiol-disulfide oxidoreductase YuxK
MGDEAALHLAGRGRRAPPHTMSPAALPFPAMVTELLPSPIPTGTDQTPVKGPLTVVYDEECGVCRESVRRLRRWDHEGRFEFMPLRLASVCGRPQLEQLAAEGHLADAVHVVDESTGRVVSGGHAALAILDALPGGWLLRPWASLPPTGAAADIVYRVAARHRDRLAWLVGLRDEVSCPVGPAARRRPEVRPIS